MPRTIKLLGVAAVALVAYKFLLGPKAEPVEYEE